MKAGRELDAMVAWKVMGWIFNDAQILVPPEHPDWVEARLPNYSTDIAAAWYVFNFLEKKWGAVYLTYHGHWTIGWNEETDKPIFGEHFIVSNQTDEGLGAEIEMSGGADTAPLAICLAALKAVGITIEMNTNSQEIGIN